MRLGVAVPAALIGFAVGVVACSCSSGRDPRGDARIGTLVVLGDSISSGGDGRPSYAGRLRRRLEAKVGAIDFHNLAVAGAGTADLRAQIARVPVPLRGPVVVVITVGGIDMMHAAISILLGNDVRERSTMGQNLTQAYVDLRRRDRFGQGVRVDAFQTNIYDASDGRGDFKSCEDFMGQLPRRACDPIFQRWNDEIAQRASEGGARLVDLHARFRGHGVEGRSRWYLGDCIHPNERGNYELARMLEEAIVGAHATADGRAHQPGGGSR